MRWIRSIIGLVIVVAVLALAMLFIVANDVKVPLNLLIIELPEQSLSTWLILTFFAGGLLGMASASIAILRLRAARHRLQKRLSSLESKPVTQAGGKFV